VSRFVLTTVTATALVLSWATASSAASVSLATNPHLASQPTSVTPADYYYNHHHYHHRRWDNHHKRWDYY
jgi:Spy/CpxP family protein refolding chaperone